MIIRNLTALGLLLCSYAVIANESAKPVFDNREWELGWTIEQEANAPKNGQIYEEYVLKGETVQNWSELVTIQFFPDLNKKTTLENFEALNKKELSKTCPSVKWRSLSNTEDERIWEWDVKDCKAAADQSDLTRIVKTDKGVFVFHYGIKKSPMPEDKKKEWEKNLKAIKPK